MKKNKQNKGEIIIYQTSKKEVGLKVRLEKDTVWLDAHQIAQLFNVNRPAIVKHINNIYKSGELSQKATCSILEQVAADGKVRKMNTYNLDMIISVGYRVNSKHATQFRIWATGILKQHILQGYTINESRLLEDKAAHLLYLTIKDHPFTDGNKRIGAFSFVYFLDKNNYLYRKNGEKKINDNALTALALLIAESDPKEKAVLINIVINLLHD